MSSKIALPVDALDGLKYGGYALLGAIATAGASDVLIELSATPGQSDGERQLALFCRLSMDGDTWSSGPVSGFSRLDESNLFPVDRLPLNSPGVMQRRVVSLRSRLGFVPPFVELVVLNLSGDALPVGGHSLAYLAV